MLKGISFTEIRAPSFQGVGQSPDLNRQINTMLEDGQRWEIKPGCPDVSPSRGIEPRESRIDGGGGALHCNGKMIHV
ncbi:MAG: hypothetical protein ACXQTE_01370 [Methanosarcinaceae archaeon]